MYNLIVNPEEYFGEIWKGWFDYLDIDISVFPKTLTKLQNICNEKHIFTIEQYNMVALKYNLPIMFRELYSDHEKFLI